VNKSEGGLPWG